MKKFLHDDELRRTRVFLQQLVQSDLTVVLKATKQTGSKVTAEQRDWSALVCVYGGADLGPVELQLVVCDPPGLLGLQPLCSLLLHVVLLQPVRLDELLEAQLTEGAQGVSLSQYICRRP